MTRRLTALLAASVVSCLLFAGVGPADAASGRVSARAIGLNAPIVEVGVKNGRLQIGDNPRVLYAKRGGDPPCDQSGSTVYAGHAWRAGNGVADRFGQLRRGDIIRVNGCRFKVTRREFWSESRSIGPLSRPGGPPRIVLYGCKADNYSKATVVFARKIGRSNPF